MDITLFLESIVYFYKILITDSGTWDGWIGDSRLTGEGALRDCLYFDTLICFRKPLNTGEQKWLPGLLNAGESRLSLVTFCESFRCLSRLPFLIVLGAACVLFRPPQNGAIELQADAFWRW